MLKIIFWVVVGLLALSYFGISLRGLVNSPANQDNISFLLNLIQNGWNALVLWLHSAVNTILALVHLHIGP